MLHLLSCLQVMNMSGAPLDLTAVPSDCPSVSGTSSQEAPSVIATGG